MALTSTMQPTKAMHNSRRAVVCKAHRNQVASAVIAATLVAGSASALTYDEVQSLTYLQVKGTGQANRCPELTTGSGPSALKAGTYTFEKMCLEPASFQVKEEGLKGVPEFVKTKLMTRLTYTLDEISGTLKVGNDGSVELKESDGIDYAAVTVQLPGGERVPFLFTIKQMDLKGNLESFKGSFTVPSYRGSSFLDPKGRGASTGYDNAVALPAKADDEELLKENIKTTKALTGNATFSISKVDPESNEIAGVFETIQPSDTDLGAKAPKDVKTTGVWYARLSK